MPPIYTSTLCQICVLPRILPQMQWGLLLLLFAYGSADQHVLICDSNNNANTLASANPKYTDYIRFLYSQGLSSTTLVMPNNCGEFDVFNTAVNAITGGVLGQADIDGRYKYCTEVYTNIQNSYKGVSLTVNWPSGVLLSFQPPQTPPVPTHTLTLHYEPSYQHEFVANTAQTTVWTSVYLTEAGQGDFSALYQLPPGVFGQPMRFSAKGFAGWEDYLIFNSPVLAKLTQVQGASAGMAWGVATTGCRPPKFILAVNWQVGPDCNRPQVRVTQIAEEEAFDCTMQFVTGDPQLTSTGLMQLAYAVAPLLGRISISTSHAQAIMGCLFPPGPLMQFFHWAQWSASAPGTCTACVQQLRAPSGATPIARMCNRSLGELGDCCFTCRPGYSSLQYLDMNNNNLQHCVAACPPGKIYDDPKAFMPRCVPCPAGKYSQDDGMACQTCATLGYSNAYAGSTGCIECGSRALATGDSSSCPGCFVACAGCPAQQWVPKGSSICQGCPLGWVLRSVYSKECSPCAAGSYASAQGQCLLCPSNTFKASEGAGACVPCSPGFQSVANRTACVPCTDLNYTLTPYAIYQPGVPGCAAMCNRQLSYPQGTNPYVPEGCIPCTALVIPNGMYPSHDDCSLLLHCINVPASNSTALLQYTGRGNALGVCPWECKPGWYLLVDTCYSCKAKGFNSSIHVYTSGCGFACLPGAFYRGPSNMDLSCTRACVRLDTVLFPRCSDYFVLVRSNGTRLLLQPQPPSAYITGYCGSNATDAGSELGVVRHKGLYGAPGGVGLCGDGMLWPVTTEECDDGNSLGGDGCSPTCKIERSDYWDCDVLGEPCLRNCGWPDLQGFALPAPVSVVPWCTGLTYRDFLKVPLAGRALWLQTHLISCQCSYNPHQTLPYSECNYTNQGCRQCLEGQFQDDLYARCSQCGSGCALGFRSFNLTTDGNNAEVKGKYGLPSLNLCSPGIATSRDLTFADPILSPLDFGRDQLKIGCAPCSAGAFNTPSQVIFTTSDCQWICRRDYSNVTQPKYYCEGPLVQPSGNCNQRCLDCALSLKTLQVPLGSSPLGWYIRSCSDGLGHAYARCTNLSDPNAFFIGNSPLIGDSSGCPWACKSGFQLMRGQCVPCKQTTCAAGQVLQPCDGAGVGSSSYYCAPCSLIKPAGALQALQVWYSVLPGYTDCVAGCEAGFSYQSGPNESCKTCSHLECDLDQLWVPCNRTSNTQCLPCPPLGPHFEFFSAGTCQSRCSQGYALDALGLVCQGCSSSITCSNGQRRSSECVLPSERLKLPTCVLCDSIDSPLNRPSPGRLWAPDCITTCRGGWMYQSEDNRTCVPCNISMCQYGQQGVCSYGNVVCTPCAFALLDLSRQFRGPGDCTLTCAPGYAGPDCQPLLNGPFNPDSSSSSSSGQPLLPVLDPMGVSITDIPNGTFPVRQRPHS